MILLFKLLSFLPLAALHVFGTGAGLLAFLLSPRSRRIARNNIALAKMDERVSAALTMIHAGRALCELPWIWMRPQVRIIAKVVEVIGQQHVEQARANAKGVIFLTPHLGCFEITAQYLAAQKPITVLYSRPKQAWLVPLVELGRTKNLSIAPADMSGVRALMRALRAGEAIGMLPDQVPGKGDGVWVPFFGEPAYTMTLAGRLSENGATVLMIYAERLQPGAGYRIVIKPILKPLSGTPQEKAGAINRAIEDLVSDCPQQYAWNYNRYKVPAGVAAPGTLIARK